MTVTIDKDGRTWSHWDGDNRPIKLWLDDERPMPVGYDTHVKTAPEAIALLATGRVQRISLDHDLGPHEAGTGYDVAKWIEEAAFHNRIPWVECHTHTANPVGRANMRASIANAERFWSRIEHGKGT